MQGRTVTVAVFSMAGVLGFTAWAAAQSPYVAEVPDRPYEVRVTKRQPDMRRLLVTPPLSEAAVKGRKVWAQRCALCHESQTALGPWIDGGTVTSIGEASARQKISTGSQRMPGFQYALQPVQIDQLVAFLNTVTPDQKPSSKRSSPGTEGGR